MSFKPVKVNDRRMFTPDGELREQFSHLADAPSPEVEAAPPRDEPAPAQPGPAAAHPAPAIPESGPPIEGYPEPEGNRSPGYLDLVGLLAEPASAYLREAQAGDPGTVAGANHKEQSLELARLHIDLLGTLRQKTTGNLSPREEAMHDDILFRLRTGYVQISR